MQGISTHSVDDLVKAQGLTVSSKGQVSRLRDEIEKRIGAFLKRPLPGNLGGDADEPVVAACRRGFDAVS